MDSSKEPAQSLAALLRTHREQILRQWTQRVVEDPSVPRADRPAEPELRDYIPKLLTALVSDLEVSESGEEGEALGRAIGASATARGHARRRAARGCSPAQAIRELSHFRATILGLCSAEGVEMRSGAAMLLHAAIDESMTTGGEEAELASVRRLREQDAFRKRITAILGHELRVPLQVIRFGAEALLAQSTMESLPIVESIVRNADRMSRRIADFVDARSPRHAHTLPVAQIRATAGKGDWDSN